MRPEPVQESLELTSCSELLAAWISIRNVCDHRLAANDSIFYIVCRGVRKSPRRFASRSFPSCGRILVAATNANSHFRSAPPAFMTVEFTPCEKFVLEHI